ncbi:hypothetical protein KJ693_11005, partial [bacterium]|nr:hypothetical protein [bacterium]
LKFKKVLGTDSDYNYYQTDADGNTIVAKSSSTSAKDITLDDAAGTITVNGQTFYVSNYSTLNDLMGAVETATGVEMSYGNGILSVAAATALDDLVISETGDSLMGVKIDTDIANASGSGTHLGLIQDYFDGFGEINQGSAIGTIDGRITGGLVNGTSTGIMRGVAGAQSGPTATVNGEIIGNLQGLFDGEGMAMGEIKIYNGYLKGDVGALDNDTNIKTPTNNAWIDGTVSGSSIGSLAGNMTGYIDSRKAPSACFSNSYDGDFKIEGHTVGFAQANTQKGIYGSIIGNAGISGVLTTAGGGLEPVTITGSGKIQGSVGGRYENSGPGSVIGSESVQGLIGSSFDPSVDSNYHNKASLDNVIVEGAVIGLLTGKVTGELYQWEGSSWSYKGQVYETNIDHITAAVVGTFTGDMNGIAQGDITMNSTSKIVGVITGLDDTGIDHDNNGIADAYITIDPESTLKGNFEGQVDIYGQIFAAESATSSNADWVRADFVGSGWLDGALYGDLEGTVDGEAHGEINGLIKHAAIDAQHFIGNGATMSAPTVTGTHTRTQTLSHLNIKFNGEAIGHVGTAVSQSGGVGDAKASINSQVSNVIEGMAGQSGAYINGTVDGVFYMSSVNTQYLIGTAEGKTILNTIVEATLITGTATTLPTIEGNIKAEVSSKKAVLEGDYDGYFTGAGEVEGLFEGTMSGIGSLVGEIHGNINDAHIIGWADGFIEGAGPVSGEIDLEGVVFYGTFTGKVLLNNAGSTMFGSMDGKMDGTYNGQIKAEKKDLAGLFTAANVATGTFDATGGTVTVADGATATVMGEEVTANENYKINQTIIVYDQLGQSTKLLVTLENLGDSEWNITTSDGGQGKLTFDTTDGSIATIDYNGQYDLDLDSIVQVAGINEIVMSQDGNAKGHLQKETLSIAADGTISAGYDNGLSQ